MGHGRAQIQGESVPIVVTEQPYRTVQSRMRMREASKPSVSPRTTPEMPTHCEGTKDDTVRERSCARTRNVTETRLHDANRIVQTSAQSRCSQDLTETRLLRVAQLHTGWRRNCDTSRDLEDPEPPVNVLHHDIVVGEDHLDQVHKHLSLAPGSAIESAPSVARSSTTRYSTAEVSHRHNSGVARTIHNPDPEEPRDEKIARDSALDQAHTSLSQLSGSSDKSALATVLLGPGQAP